MSVVDVCLVEDDAVIRKINSTSKTLKNKYQKKRKINHAILKEKSKLQKVFCAVFDVFMVLIILFALSLCLSIAVSRINNTVSSFAGYNIFQISSGSMTKSGFNMGDTVIAKSVDTDSLKIGDTIGFYVYQPSYSTFNKHQTTQITEFEKDIKASVSFSGFFGFASAEHTQAGKADSKVVFHNIVAVFDDENGERWFQTQGTSNEEPDFWRINEKYVIGAYTNSGGFDFARSVLTFMTNEANFILLLLVPFLFFSVLITLNILKQVQLVKLELDIVEEKRKITDEICVKHNVGYNMDIKTKYKVLAQAEDEDKSEYMHLLWKSGEIPTGVRKYVLRKQITLNYMKAMLNLNRTCEQMLKDNTNLTKIAKHYIAEKEKIETSLRRKPKKIKG